MTSTHIDKIPCGLCGELMPSVVFNIEDLHQCEINLNKGIKHDKEKIRLDLIPPEAVMALGEILTFGARKYGDNNWQKGIKISRLAGAMLRHWFQSVMGEKNDKESGLPHTWHMFCNAMFIIWMEQILLRNEYWRRCMSCGFMEKVNKKKVEPK